MKFRETTRTDVTSRSAESDSRPVASGEAKPPTVEVLRAKLDAAIVAEAWDAVKAIRERLVDVERTGIADLNAERLRRR